MIKINLLNTTTAPGGLVFESAGPEGLSQSEIQKQGALRLLVIFLGPVALWMYQQNSIPELIKTRSSLNSQLTEVQEFNNRAAQSVEEIKRFKQDEERIKARIAYLDRISKNRNREIKILELIQQTIPEKAWLNKLQMSSGRMVIGGMALSDYDVSSFMEGLSRSVFFTEVNLLSSAETNFDGLNLKGFEISCLTERRSE